LQRSGIASYAKVGVMQVFSFSFGAWCQNGCIGRLIEFYIKIIIQTLAID
jgi:hypothetical protein